jgi:hypothetical protein
LDQLGKVMTKAPKEGTIEWFDRARHRCIDHLRALLSIRSAHECIQVNLSQWDSMQPIVRAALHSNCVIAYARPFTPAMTKHGKIRYPVKEIQSASGFDKELHQHIMDLRDRIVAHSDYDVFPSTMFLQAIGDEKLPISLGINVKGLVGIATRDLAERYEKHLSSCASAIESALNADCLYLTEQARIYPAEFDKTHNVPAVTKRISNTAQPIAFRPAGPAAGVADPPFPSGLSDYRYLTLTHEIPLIESGKHQITVNGVATEMTLDVYGGAAKKA